MIAQGVYETGKENQNAICDLEYQKISLKWVNREKAVRKYNSSEEWESRQYGGSYTEAGWKRVSSFLCCTTN